MDFNLYPLWAFVSVVRHGSLTKAAAQLRITQPAVSAHIKALEQRFQDRLLHRGAKGITLTRLGETVYAQALVVFEEFEELGSLAGGHSRTRQVWIAASHTPGVYWLPSRLAEFRRTHPIECRYQVADSSQVVEQVLNHSIPFGIVGDLPAVGRRELHQIEVGQDSLQLMCSAEHPLRDKKQFRQHAFTGQTLLLRSPGSSTRLQAEAMLGAELIRSFGRILELNSGEAIKEAVLAGLGMAVLSSWSVTREVKAGLVFAVGPERWRQNRSLSLIRLADREPRGAALLLWSFLEGGV